MTYRHIDDNGKRIVEVQVDFTEYFTGDFNNTLKAFVRQRPDEIKITINMRDNDNR